MGVGSKVVGNQYQEEAKPTTFADMGAQNLYSSKNIEESNVYKLNIVGSRKDIQGPQVPANYIGNLERKSERRSEMIQFNASPRSIDTSYKAVSPRISGVLKDSSNFVTNAAIP